jgi:hypothetical protein
MTLAPRWTAAALLLGASILTASPAAAQANVAAVSYNGLAQGHASDAGYYSPLNGPLDGNNNGMWDASTFWASLSPNGSWWYVDLGQNYSVSSMTFYNRTDGATYRSVNALFQLWSSTPDFVNGGALFTSVLDASAVQTFDTPNVTARYASVQAGNCGHWADCYLNFAEVQVNAVPVTATPEPATIGLLATGLVGFGAFFRRKRAQA